MLFQSQSTNNLNTVFRKLPLWLLIKLIRGVGCISFSYPPPPKRCVCKITQSTASFDFMKIVIVNPKYTEFKLIHFCRDFSTVALFLCISPSTWGFQISRHLLRLSRRYNKLAWEKPCTFAGMATPFQREERVHGKLRCRAPKAA